MAGKATAKKKPTPRRKPAARKKPVERMQASRSRLSPQGKKYFAEYSKTFNAPNVDLEIILVDLAETQERIDDAERIWGGLNPNETDDKIMMLALRRINDLRAAHARLLAAAERRMPKDYRHRYTNDKDVLPDGDGDPEGGVFSDA